MPQPAAAPPTSPVPTPARPVDQAVASDFEAGWHEARAVVHDAPRAVVPPGDDGSSARELFAQGVREGVAWPVAPEPVVAPTAAPVRQPAASGAEARAPAPPSRPTRGQAPPPTLQPAPAAPSRASAPPAAPVAVPIATLQQMLEARTLPPPSADPALPTTALPNPVSQASLDFWHAYAQQLPPGHELRGPLEQAVQASRSAQPPAAAAMPPQVLHDDERDGPRTDGAETLEAAQQALEAHLAGLTPALLLAKAT